MKHILIAIVAMFTIMGTQAAEPRTNKKSVKKILKEIKSLAGNHIRVEEYNGDSIVNDVKNQLNAQFEDKKAAEVFEKYKIKLDKDKYTFEGERPSIHYYEGNSNSGYNKMSGNAWFYQLSRNKAGTKIYDGTMECVWAADTLGMRVRQYYGMKNVTIYMIDIPEERQCATLIVNGGLKTFKDFFNSYTLNGEERVADKYNVIFTIGGDKVQSTKEEVNGKKSGLHLKFAPLEKARAKGLLPLYEYSM